MFNSQETMVCPYMGEGILNLLKVHFSFYEYQPIDDYTTSPGC